MRDQQNMVDVAKSWLGVYNLPNQILKEVIEN